MGTFAKKLNENRGWQAKYIPAVIDIVGPRLMTDATLEQDTTEATDLVVLKARDMRVACRVRRAGYNGYKNDFTIRSRARNGGRTEYDKLIAGFGDWMFYGHALDNIVPEFSDWMIIDLHAWREHMIKNRASIRTGEKHNGDGTAFRWYDVRSFPADPPLLIDGTMTPPQLRLI